MSKPVTPIVRKLMSTSKVGVVVSAGRMDKAVKVRIAAQEWNKRFRKHFPSEQTYLVADPNDSLVEGDVVRIASGWRTSQHIRHVVTSIVAPFGEPVENRPPILTEEERMAIRVRQRLAKDVRQAAKGRQTSIARLAQARKEKLDIPTLEEAMSNVRLVEEEARIEAGGSGEGSPSEPHRGATGQVLTNKERRAGTGKKIGTDKNAEEKVKEAKVQTV